MKTRMALSELLTKLYEAYSRLALAQETLSNLDKLEETDELRVEETTCYHRIPERY